MKRSGLLSAPMVAVSAVWLLYMLATGAWPLILEGWFMSITMAFGSFVAGASAEGGGAVAFPVMTLVFRIPPDVARNFGLAIQSVGMTSASYLILRSRIPIEPRYLYPCSLGGVIGIVMGTEFVVPHVPAAHAKMLFVALWLSFACVLFYINFVQHRRVRERLPILPLAELVGLAFAGAIGGCLSAIVGSGIDILTFSYVTLRFRLSEKVATPSSVVLMAGNSIVGFVLHALILKDFGPSAFQYWLVCIPVVVFGAPIGAYFVSTRSRRFIAVGLCGIIVVQFIGAWWTIHPTGQLLWFTLGVFAGGLLFFWAFHRRAGQDPTQGPEWRP